MKDFYAYQRKNVISVSSTASKMCLFLTFFHTDSFFGNITKETTKITFVSDVTIEKRRAEKTTKYLNIGENQHSNQPLTRHLSKRS
jgi:hypothetical protein